MIEVNIENIATNITKGTTPTTLGNHFTESGIPFLRAQNVINNELFLEDLLYIDNNTHQNALKRSKIKTNDVLITIAGTIGRVAVVPNCDIEFNCNQAIAIITPDTKKILPNYLRYCLRSESVIKQVNNGMVTATIPNLSLSQIRGFSIPLPSLPTQKKIAEILDTADSLRQKDKALIEKYNQLTQSLFLEMFGDPVNNTKGWELKKLKNISIKIHSGNTPKGGSDVYVSEGITFFRSQNVWRNRLDVDDVAYIDQDTHNKMSKSSLKHGDILMTKTGRFNTENSSLGRAAMFLGEDDSANVNGHVYLIRLQKNIVNEFILFILTTDEYREHIRRVCVGGIDKRQLNKDHIEDFPIIWPPIELQKKFVEKLKSIEKLKNFTEESAKKSEALFNSLLQKAFTGELVEDDEAYKSSKKQTAMS